MKAGDNCVFSYRVIYDLIQKEYEGELIFRNLLKYGEHEYFVCDITNLFAVVRGNEIIMQNGYVMTTPFVKSTIILPHQLRRAKGCVKAQILNIGYPLSTKKSISVTSGDEVQFNPNIAQQYKLNGKNFCILQQSQILGMVIE